MSSNLVSLPPTKRVTKRRCKWKVIDTRGNEFIVEGTSIATEESTFTVHVYDDNECILVVQQGCRVEIMDDPRLQVLPKKRARRTKK